MAKRKRGKPKLWVVALLLMALALLPGAGHWVGWEAGPAFDAALQEALSVR